MTCSSSPAPAVTTVDTMIVTRAAQLVSSPDKWNRQDDDSGTCPANASSYTIRCALRQASNDVIGEYDANSPLMRKARATVDALPHKKYDARPVDYDNDSERTLADVQAYLVLLKSRLAGRIGKP